ncbi:hypothetical protein GQ457_01G010000 [Hibiscus cannabinus]
MLQKRKNSNGGASKTTKSENFFGGQSLEDKQEMAEVKNDMVEPNFSGDGEEDEDPVEADDLAEVHPHDE